MQYTKSLSIPLPIFAAILIGLMVFSVGEYVYLNDKNMGDTFRISGSFKLYENGHLVIQQDAITYGAYATVICKLFNDSTACDLANGMWNNNLQGTGTFVGNGCPKNQVSTTRLFNTDSPCMLTGIALSTDTTSPGTTPTGATCPNIITTNGMSPVVATTSYVANQNSITLTAQWTASGSQTFDKACLVAVMNTVGNTGSATYWTFGAGSVVGSNSFAIQLFTGQSVTTGQTWSAQWTFNF